MGYPASVNIQDASDAELLRAIARELGVTDIIVSIDRPEELAILKRLRSREAFRLVTREDLEARCVPDLGAAPLASELVQIAMCQNESSFPSIRVALRPGAGLCEQCRSEGGA